MGQLPGKMNIKTATFTLKYEQRSAANSFWPIHCLLIAPLQTVATVTMCFKISVVNISQKFEIIPYLIIILSTSTDLLNLEQVNIIACFFC